MKCSKCNADAVMYVDVKGQEIPHCYDCFVDSKLMPKRLQNSRLQQVDAESIIEARGYDAEVA